MTESRDTVARLFAAWAALDADAICACFTKDGVWHNMPYPPITGRDAIRAAVAGFLGNAREVRFEVRYEGEVAPGIVMNERVDIFCQTDGKVIRIPVTGVFEIKDGLIRAWRDYFDVGSLTPA